MSHEPMPSRDDDFDRGLRNRTAVLGEDGFVALPEDLLLAQGLDSYHGSRQLGRFAYALPDRKPQMR